MDATNAIQLLNADSHDQHLYNLIIICRSEMGHPLIKEIMPETNKCTDFRHQIASLSSSSLSFYGVLY